ncbi:MAG: DUF6465 family protein [Acutalibacteraceae bacterium]
MATEKKTTAAKATKETKETKTTAKKAPAKKTTAKKAPAKKAPAKKTTKKVAPKVSVYIEYGEKQVSVDEVIKNVETVNGKTAKEYKIYIKPEESKAYFVADGEEKEMDVFFC